MKTKQLEDGSPVGGGADGVGGHGGVAEAREEARGPAVRQALQQAQGQPRGLGVLARTYSKHKTTFLSLKEEVPLRLTIIS